MAKTWTLEYRSIRTGEWNSLGGNFFGRTGLDVVRRYHPELLTLRREWRVTPGPDKPTPKSVPAFTIPL